MREYCEQAKPQADALAAELLLDLDIALCHVLVEKHEERKPDNEQHNRDNVTREAVDENPTEVGALHGGPSNGGVLAHASERVGRPSLGQTCAVASEGRTNHQVHRGGDDTKNEHLDEVATGEEQCRYGAAGVDDTSERKDRQE